MSFKLRLQAKWSPSLHWLTISVAIVGCLAMAAKYIARGVLLDWDIDTFIEISNQFIRGRLIYLDYFDPKWPHIQPLFVVAAVTRSASIQILFSSLMIVVTGILISRLPCDLSDSGRPTQASIMCGAFYIVITPYLPGGIQGQLGVYASLLLVCSVTLYLRGSGRQGIYHALLIGLAGFLVGYAIGIRPNLIIPATLMIPIVYYLFRPNASSYCILLGGLLLGIFIPFVTYMQSPERLQIAWSGSIGILQEWNRSFYEEITLAQFGQQLSVLWSPKLFSVPFFLFIPLIASCCLLQTRESHQQNLKILISMILWELGLIISYRISHIHHHYILLEWVGILAGISLMQSCKPRRMICLSFCVVVMVLTVIPMKPLSDQDRGKLLAIKGFNELIAAVPRDKQISAPSLPRLHWQNNKPIKTRGIHPVWSLDIMHRDLKGIHAQRLELDRTWEQQCDLWLQPDVVYFFADDYLARQCRIEGSKDWQLDEHSKDSNINIQGIKVYSRNHV